MVVLRRPGTVADGLQTDPRRTHSFIHVALASEMTAMNVEGGVRQASQEEDHEFERRVSLPQPASKPRKLWGNKGWEAGETTMT